VDICRDYDTVGYPLATEADLAQTVKAVEALDRRIVATQADVAQLGHLDIVPANAGICTVLFLASDEARYVTGLEFTVDAGNTTR
jgi:NAD(P)-dependent dehydrogenase (short-subunit alcohol dehydrogenase family)